MRFIHTLIIFIIIATAALGAIYLQSTREPAVKKLEPITVGVPMMLDASALVYIAEDRGYFADNGLSATINVYDAGAFAVDDLLKDKNDIAVATEFVMVDKVLKQEKLSSMATTSKYEIHYLIGRRDRGIEDVSDLRGKRIGAAGGTSGPFFLSRFLMLHGINATDITLADVKPAQYADAIANGSVDAVLAWDPHTGVIEERLGPNAVVWPAQSGQLGYWNVIVRDGWAAQHPETASRFLKSIDQAVAYTIYHPADAKAILHKGTGFDEKYIETTLRNTQFSLSLDRSLITAMEDEGRWMITGNLTEVEKLPDFMDNLYTDGLSEIKPAAVNILHGREAMKAEARPNASRKEI